MNIVVSKFIITQSKRLTSHLATTTEAPKQQELSTSALDTPFGSPSLNQLRTPDDDQIKNDQEFEHIINQFDGDNEKDGILSHTVQELPNRRRSSADTPAQPRRPSSRSEEIPDIPFDFNNFLEQMKRRGAIPITKYFKRYARRKVHSAIHACIVLTSNLTFPQLFTSIWSSTMDCEWADQNHPRFSRRKFVVAA